MSLRSLVRAHPRRSRHGLTVRTDSPCPTSVSLAVHHPGAVRGGRTAAPPLHHLRPDLPRHTCTFGRSEPARDLQRLLHVLDRNAHVQRAAQVRAELRRRILRHQRGDDAQLPHTEREPRPAEHLAVALFEHPRLEVRVQAGHTLPEPFVLGAVHPSAHRFPPAPPLRRSAARRSAATPSAPPTTPSRSARRGTPRRGSPGAALPPPPPAWPRARRRRACAPAAPGRQHRSRRRRRRVPASPHPSSRPPPTRL